MIKRDKFSHKGQNGRVAVVGGSPEYYGAPILSALGAEAMGVDLIYPVIPKSHCEIAKLRSLNFILENFTWPYLTLLDNIKIKKILSRSDVLVIGPGLGDRKPTIKTVRELVELSSVPVVLDASGLAIIPEIIKSKTVLPPNTILTPQAGEFSQMTGLLLPEQDEEKASIVQSVAAELESVILLKGSRDIIASSENYKIINKKGNAGLTVGGTGDVLSGVVGGLVAQGVSVFEACEQAVILMGRAGEILYKKYGYKYRAEDVVDLLRFKRLDY